MAEHPLASVDEPMSEAIAQLQDGHPVILKHEGSALAALITLKDLHLLELYFEELEDRIDKLEVEKALEEIEREGVVPWELVKEEVRRSNP
jgi:cell division protein ZapA (FtsZ GTPase activity inhibitor)